MRKGGEGAVQRHVLSAAIDAKRCWTLLLAIAGDCSCVRASARPPVAQILTNSIAARERHAANGVMSLRMCLKYGHLRT